MKKIQNIGILAALASGLLFSSCSNDYLDRTPTTALDTEVVLSDPAIVPSTVVGTMKLMSSYGFGGRDATVIGDVVTDIVSTAERGSNGTLLDMERWNIHASLPDVSGFWAGGYAIAASAARTIEAANRLLADSANNGVTEATIKNLYNAIAASLTMKVYAEYFLLQYFCVDVNIGNYLPELSPNGAATMTVPGLNPTKVGIILMDGKPISNTEPANMSTLDASYAFLEREIQQAIDYFDKSGNTSFSLATEARFYPTKSAALLLKARIYLAQHKHSEAIQAAEDALGALPSGANKQLLNATNFAKAYGETLSSEDIWSLNYTSQDNLSANSLSNFFGSYGAKASDKATKLFKNSDIRKPLYSPKSGNKSYCLKYPNDNGIFNVPMMRVPELYLIQAEAYAYLDRSTEAKEALFHVLGARDTMVKSVADIDSRYNVGTKADLLKTILDENAREFMCEGHRWSDLRRNGVRLSREGNSSDETQKWQLYFRNYPLSTFAFPVPYSETSTDQWQNGRGILSDGSKAQSNWQNNAWDNLSGGQYSNTGTLPKNDEDYLTNAH